MGSKVYHTSFGWVFPDLLSWDSFTSRWEFVLRNWEPLDKICLGDEVLINWESLERRLVIVGVQWGRRSNIFWGIELPSGAWEIDGF